MKAAGIDGVLIDWYGIEGSNSDLSSLALNSEAIIREISSSGLQFAVVIEDRFWASAATAHNNLLYLNRTHFQSPEYFRDENGRPLVL